MFKIGDKVRCVDDYGRTSSIQKGEIYKIDRIIVDVTYYFELENINDRVSFSSGRFNLLHKCKATKLARKMYPDAKEEDGMLILEDV